MKHEGQGLSGKATEVDYYCPDALLPVQDATAMSSWWSPDTDQIAPVQVGEVWTWCLLRSGKPC